MTFLRIYIIALLLCAVGQTANCQTAIIDSLRKKIYAATNDEEKLTAFLSLFEEFQSVNRDSLDIYGPQVKDLAEKVVANVIKVLQRWPMPTGIFAGVGVIVQYYLLNQNLIKIQ